MIEMINNDFTRIAVVLLVGLVVLCAGGCSTAPPMKDRTTFVSESRVATTWFETNVPGLRSQIDSSAGYAIFPAVGQWGVIFGGGKFGRGTLNNPGGVQLGWAAVNTGSLGLQAGVQGFKMLIVFEDGATLQAFKENRLSGAVSAVALVGESGGSAQAPFENGVAIYQGANTGLMAGVNVGLDYLRYEPLARSR